MAANRLNRTPPLTLSSAADLKKSVEGLSVRWEIDGLKCHLDAYADDSDREGLSPWHYYYLALARYLLIDRDEDQAGDHLDNAISLLQCARGADENIVEFYALMAACHGRKARAVSDPIGKCKWGISSDRLFRQAYQADAKNPRLLLLDGLGYLMKPRMVGGSKRKSMRLFEEAIEAFGLQQEVDSEPAPTWGLADCQTWLAQCYIKFNQFDKAAAAINQAERLAPTLPLVEATRRAYTNKASR